MKIVMIRCAGLEDLYHLFMTTRTAHTELGLESSKMVDASTKRPWAVPIDGTVNITVRHFMSWLWHISYSPRANRDGTSK
jgi:hypothetical protein